jgi:hypothetical protein
MQRIFDFHLHHRLQCSAPRCDWCHQPDFNREHDRSAAIAPALATARWFEVVGKTILAIATSFAERYLSTDLIEGI